MSYGRAFNRTLSNGQRCRFVVVLCTLVLLLIAEAYAAPSFKTALDRNVVSVGESFTLSLIFESLNPNTEPPLPTIPNVSVSGVTRGQSFSFVNGVQSATYTLNYTLAANQPGDVTIPGMTVVAADGKTYTSQPLQLKILAASAAQAALTNLASLRLVVGKTEVYAGEPFPVEMHFYWNSSTRPDERDFRYPQLRAEGFSLGQMAKPTQTRTQIGNAIYNVIILRLTATAARTGDVTLGPAEQAFTLLIPTGRRDFFGPQLQPRPMNLTSDSIPMRVLPLPSRNVPEGFNGAIGTYQMEFDAGPTNLGVGDPITVRVQISGQGPLDAIAFPPQSQWRDFNSYPPTAKVETTDELGLAGTKNFEQVLIPQNHEIKELPPFRFSFFDPNAKSYRTLTGPTVPLAVRPTATASVPPPSLTNASVSPATQQAADDIIHIRPRFELTGTAPLLLNQPWFIALQGLPALAWLSLLVWRRRAESLANNPRLRRQREVAQRVREGLKELRARAEARESDQFFATLFRLLQEQLGERLDLPASAITEAVIDERLRGRTVSEDTLKRLHELFQACNLARYAPVQSSQELAAFIPKAETTLRELQNLS